MHELMRAAAIDVGTNTVRLLVADVRGSELADVDRDTEITRLGRGVDSERRLDRASMERTMRAVEAFAARARAAGADPIRVAGTSVLRDAADRDAFAAMLWERTQIELDILSGEEEARISFLGATFELPRAGYVVCDIGGGSTELSTGDGGISMDVGSVRLTERVLRDEPPTGSQIADARAIVRAALDGYAAPPDAAFVGVAGTVTTIAALVLGLPSYDRDRIHRCSISASDVIAWSERLLSMTPDEIVALGPVPPKRADVLGAGALILRTVVEHLGSREVLVSERDILDGLVLDLVR